MLAFLLLILSQAAPPPSAAAAPEHDVVVTGHSLASTERALKACLARHCPTDEDIAATLAHAENEFVSGRYDDARKTLLASVGRNKGAAARYPVAVSDLWRANSRIAAHLGRSEDYRISAIASADALKAGLPKDDFRVLAQRVEVADAFAHLGRIQGAVDAYRDVAHDAHNAGLPLIEGTALLKIAGLYTAVAHADPGGYSSTARHAITELQNNTDPQLAQFRAAAGLLLAKLDGKGSDDPAVARAAAVLGVSPGTKPELIYAPPIDEQQSLRAFRSGSALSKAATEDYDGQWFDVSFTIAADGQVSEAQVIRESPTLDGFWEPAVLKSIRGRRYAPLALPAGSDGMTRVERFTRTAHYFTDLRSRIEKHEPFGRIETLDLTNDASVAGTGTKPAGG